MSIDLKNECLQINITACANGYVLQKKSFYEDTGKAFITTVAYGVGFSDIEDDSIVGLTKEMLGDIATYFNAWGDKYSSKCLNISLEPGSKYMEVGSD